MPRGITQIKRMLLRKFWRLPRRGKAASCIASGRSQPEDCKCFAEKLLHLQAIRSPIRCPTARSVARPGPDRSVPEENTFEKRLLLGNSPGTIE